LIPWIPEVSDGGLSLMMPNKFLWPESVHQKIDTRGVARMAMYAKSFLILEAFFDPSRLSLLEGVKRDMRH